MASNDNVKFSIKVPLGDAEHKSETKGSTKVVRRKLTGLKGTKPKRTGIVFWRGAHLVATENPENVGSFIAGKKAKASDVPEAAAKPKATTKAPAKKTAAKAKARGKKTAKESDRRNKRAA